MPSLSWDGMAALYDESRRADDRRMGEALDHLAGLFPPAAFPRVVEPGIGNGRIALPLAERGYRVSGVDISLDMLDALERKLSGSPLAARVDARQGDATALPWGAGEFDLALAAHLFWFVDGWERAVDELRRVLKPAGPIVLFNTGSGLEVPRLNDRYKALCAERGCAIRNPGAVSTREVVEYLAARGHAIEEIKGRWTWTAAIPVAAAFRFVSERAYSFTRLVPEEIHAQVVAALREELPRWAEMEDVPNDLSVTIARPG